jgi:RNA 2',3'-cyclic 3'-phosphodiesterase
LDKIRTFLSLNIESSAVKDIAEILNKTKQSLIKYPVKWENPEKLHLTLRFLGDISEDKIDDLVFTLDRLKLDFETIDFTSNGIGFFPNAKYPNVVFVGLEEKGSNSGKLVEFIDKIILNFGVKPDKRFIPHITLGRFRRDKRIKITEMIEINAEPINVQFDCFYLMKSTLTPKGSVYEIINEFKFSK